MWDTVMPVDKKGAVELFDMLWTELEAKAPWVDRAIYAETLLEISLDLGDY